MRGSEREARFPTKAPAGHQGFVAREGAILAGRGDFVYQRTLLGRMEEPPRKRMRAEVGTGVGVGTAAAPEGVKKQREWGPADEARLMEELGIATLGLEGLGVDILRANGEDPLEWAVVSDKEALVFNGNDDDVIIEEDDHRCLPMNSGGVVRLPSGHLPRCCLCGMATLDMASHIESSHAFEKTCPYAYCGWRGHKKDGDLARHWRLTHEHEQQRAIRCLHEECVHCAFRCDSELWDHAWAAHGEWKAVGPRGEKEDVRKVFAGMRQEGSMVARRRDMLWSPQQSPVESPASSLRILTFLKG